jgi:hypothetical protein
MLFVGRKSEKNKIVASLRQGKNIILGGKFGIGRTSIIKEIAVLLADENKFIFVDFGLTPAKMSEKLMKGLALFARFTKSNKKMGYKSMRYRISNFESSEKKQPVIVFDNIAKLTNQKIIFLRHLVLEKHFQFVAIVENFLSPNDLYRLKALLLPVDLLSLHHLKTDDVLSFMRLYSEKHNLNWSNVFIRKMADLIGGYPLGLITTINTVTNKSV